VTLELHTGVPSYHVDDGLPRRRVAGGGKKAEFIYSFTCQLRKTEITTAGVCGGRITRALIRGRYLWLR
jgi:hypothetical protein